MDLFLNVMCAIVSSIAFSIFFIVPKKAIVYCTITGTISWIVYSIFGVLFLFTVIKNSIFIYRNCYVSSRI